MSSLSLKSGSVHIRAAKVPTADILLYTGDLMTVPDVGPVVLDLAGLTIGSSVPICADHETSIRATLGSGRATVENGQLRVRGELTATSDDARHILALSKAGVELQASVGAEILESRPIRAGERVFVNGRHIVAGPAGFELVTKSRLLEATVCVFGADPETSTKIAASAAKGKSIMSFEEYCVSLGIDPSKLTADGMATLQGQFDAANPGGEGGGGTATATMQATRTSRASDLRRIAAIEATAREFPLIAAKAVEEGWSQEKTELAVIRASRSTGPANVNRGDQEVDDAQVIEASLLQSANMPEKILAKYFDQRTLNASMSKQHRGQSIPHVFNAVLRASGKSTGWQKIGNSQIAAVQESDRMIRASGFSTISAPGILGSAANKLLLSSFDAIPMTWNQWCGIQSAKDFKEFTAYMFTVKGELEEVAPAGHLKHVTVQENEYSNQLETRGAMIQLTRKNIINDDLGAFASVPRAFGRMGAMSLEKQAYKGLMSNLSTIFTTGRGNYFSGADSALSIASLGVAEQKFLAQLDENGDPMLLMPQLLLVPGSLSADSSVVVRDTSVQHPSDIDTAQSTGNPHGGKFTSIVSPWLDNSNMAGSDADHWFLLARAMADQGLINVGFLDGVNKPTIEEGDVDFSQLGMAWRVYFDFGVAVGDYRFGVRSKGKA